MTTTAPRTPGVRVATTLLLLSEPPADSWTGGLTDSRDLRITRIRVAETPEPTSLLTAPRLSAPPEGSHEVHWRTEVEGEIRSYLELVPDWDSYGGGPVRTEIVDWAVQIAEIMAGIGFSRPDVSPESSGGVLLEWQQADRVLTVDLDGIEGFSFAYESPGEPASEGDIEDFFSLLRAGLQPF